VIAVAGLIRGFTGFGTTLILADTAGSVRNPGT